MGAVYVSNAARALVAGLCLAATPASAYDWLQYNGGPAHTGNNVAETTLTAANVATLVRQFQVPLPAVADGAPVVLQAVATGGGTRDLLFVTTKAGDTVALDAKTGTQLWIRQYPAGTCKINNGSNACYTTSSPAIDPNRQIVYAYGLDGKAHKLLVEDGTEITTDGWPQTTTLKGYDEKASSALATATAAGVTYLYVAHGGYPGDNGDYQGHITAINLATGAQTVFNTMCSGQPVHFTHAPATPVCATPRSAIWARPGVVYDAGINRIFVATGNGSFNAGTNWSESVLALNPDGTGVAGGPLDSYTPTNFAALDIADADLGSTAPAILPVPASSDVQHLAVQGGKDAKLRLVNLANLSGLSGPGHTGGEVGTVINVPQGGDVLSQPAVWVNPADATTWVFVANGGGISGLQLVVGATGTPALTPRWQRTGGGFSPLVANSVLYYAGNNALRALDPATGTLLWTGTAIGGIHWQSPVVANGMVYVADQAGKLTAYGLPASTPTTTTLASSANPSVVGAGVTFTATVTDTVPGPPPTGSVTFSDGPTTLGGCGGVPVVSGRAQCAAAALGAGSHGIVATYDGDAATSASMSPVLTQLVNPAGSVINVALASNGGVASASSTFAAGFPVGSLNDNERAGAGWGSGGGWNDGTGGVFPDWAQVTFNAVKTIDRVVVYTLQDNFAAPIEPTDALTFSQWGITHYKVNTWSGVGWVPQATIAGNNLVKRTTTFSPIATDRVRIDITGALGSYSRLTEIEAWTAGAAPPASSTALASSQNPATAGAAVTFTATVVGNNPTGTVAFTDGGAGISTCAGVAVSAGRAACTTRALAVGSHAIAATYSGDAGNAGSTSPTLTQVVSAGTSVNVALASNGGVASASSTFTLAGNSFVASALNDGERAGANWGHGGGWNDATFGSFPDWVQIRFSRSRTIDRVVAYTLQDSYGSPVEPSDTQAFTLYGVTDFVVQAWTGSRWTNLVTVTGNHLVKRTATFPPTTTSRIRVRITGSVDGWSRLTEIEAWGT